MVRVSVSSLFIAWWVCRGRVGLVSEVASSSPGEERLTVQGVRSRVTPAEGRGHLWQRHPPPGL